MMRLVGIPWGKKSPPEEANCLTLAIYAQKILWSREVNLDMGVDWTDETLRIRSHEIGKEIARFAIKIDEPEPGDVGIIETCGYCHLVTFVSPDRILHTILDGKSRISRLRRKEVSAWRVQ